MLVRACQERALKPRKTPPTEPLTAKNQAMSKLTLGTTMSSIITSNETPSRARLLSELLQLG